MVPPNCATCRHSRARPALSERPVVSEQSESNQSNQASQRVGEREAGGCGSSYSANGLTISSPGIRRPARSSE